MARGKAITKGMRKIFLLVFLMLAVGLASEAKNDRVVVMISLDGCRWDYPLWYDTPFFDSMAEKGVEAGLIPSYPSKTFPNHYTIATGLYPDHHGIIANSFLDRETDTVFSLGDPATKGQGRFWGGEPIWLTAKHQGVKTAVFYWPGSDVAIKGEYPDTYYIYDTDERLPMEVRVDEILKTMQKDDHPQLVMSYMEEPDYSGHAFGPQARETRKAVQRMDSLMQRLYNGLMALPYADNIDFLVVSDHGMALVTPERRISVKDKLKPEWVYSIEGNMPAHIYANEGCQDSIYNALCNVDHVRVWKKGDVPEIFHYGTNRYCGDVIVSPDLGYIFTDGKVTAGGQHGFDPYFNDMHALFRAVGPDFRHMKFNHFPNVDVYPLVCHLLGIKAAECDGDLNEVKDILLDKGE